MKKYLALLLAALMLLSCLAGCSSADDTTTPPTETTQDAPQTTDKEDAAPAEPVETADELEGEITFWHSFTQGPRLERIQAAADSFMEKHPKVKIIPRSKSTLKPTPGQTSTPSGRPASPRATSPT